MQLPVELLVEIIQAAVDIIPIPELLNLRLVNSTHISYLLRGNVLTKIVRFIRPRDNRLPPAQPTPGAGRLRVQGARQAGKSRLSAEKLDQREMAKVPSPLSIPIPSQQIEARPARAMRLLHVHAAIA